MTGETGNICRCRRKEETDGVDCTSSGRVFQKMEAATLTHQKVPVFCFIYALSYYQTYTFNGDRLLTDGTAGRAAAA